MLIANIGNQHFGNIEIAKELIKTSHNCGADLIKMLAITPTFEGQLEKEFYEMCSFCYDEYIELIEYTKSIGNDLCFEIYGKSNETLLYHQAWRTITTYDLNKTDLYISDIDKDTSLVSIGNELFPPTLLNANILHTMEKLSDKPNLERINVLKRIYNRNIGYCDKTIGIESCLKANDIYNANIIEKYITLEKGTLFKGKVIEETVYSILPRQFEELSHTLMVFKEDIVLH